MISALTLKQQEEVTTSKLGWRIPTLAQALDVSPNFLRKEIKNGNLKARNLGRCVVVLTQDLNEYLKGNDENKKAALEAA